MVLFYIQLVSLMSKALFLKLKTLTKINFRRIFLYIFVFIFCLYIPKDPDLGWHLKYGEYLFENHQILRDNTFSSEMPDYKFVNHSWLSDLIVFLFYNFGGFFGIALLSSIVLTLTFFFFSKALKLIFFQEVFIFPLLLLFEAPLFKNSYRGQFLSFLGISLLFYILSKEDKKSLLFIPLLFLIWANLHGQFILGLGLFLIWIIFKLIRYLKNIPQLVNEAKFLSIIFLTTFLSTLLNPFGVKIYEEVFKHAANDYQKYITEWSPVEEYSIFWWYLIIWLLLLGISSLKIVFQKKLTKYFYYIFISLSILLISFHIGRYSWVALLISIPVIAQLFDFVGRANNFIKNSLINLLLVLGLTFLIFIKIPDIKLTKMNWEKYCQYLLCSPTSAQILENHLNSYNLLTDYNWGGWLIWNYPKIKPSIDGRMHLWKDEKGYSAFEEYIQIETNQTDIEQTKYDLVYISPRKPVFSKLIELYEQGKWEILYADEYAFIFKRK